MYFEVVPIEWKGKKVLVSLETQDDRPPSKAAPRTLFVPRDEWDMAPVVRGGKVILPEHGLRYMSRTLEAGSASLGYASVPLVPR
jgi:hypothetical protein